MLKAELSLRKWQTLELEGEAEDGTCVEEDLDISMPHSNSARSSCLSSLCQDWSEGESRCPISQANVTHQLCRVESLAKPDGMLACRPELTAHSRSCTSSQGLLRRPLLKLQAKHKWRTDICYTDNLREGMAEGVRILEEMQSQQHQKHWQMSLS